MQTGGGVFIFKSSFQDAITNPVMMYNTTIIYNKARSAGGIYSYQTQLSFSSLINNVIIENNNAEFYGS